MEVVTKFFPSHCFCELKREQDLQLYSDIIPPVQNSRGCLTCRGRMATSTLFAKQYTTSIVASPLHNYPHILWAGKTGGQKESNLPHPFNFPRHGEMLTQHSSVLSRGKVRLGNLALMATLNVSQGVGCWKMYAGSHKPLYTTYKITHEDWTFRHRQILNKVRHYFSVTQLVFHV